MRRDYPTAHQERHPARESSPTRHRHSTTLHDPATPRERGVCHAAGAAAVNRLPFAGDQQTHANRSSLPRHLSWERARDRRRARRTRLPRRDDRPARRAQAFALCASSRPSAALYDQTSAPADVDACAEVGTVAVGECPRRQAARPAPRRPSVRLAANQTFATVSRDEEHLPTGAGRARCQ
jgi:hypothetical protein